MSVFRQIADRVVIYPVCVYFLILAGRDSFETVIAVLVSVACVSFCAASGKRMVTGAVCAAYLLASFLAGKAFACFLPSMLYEMCSLLPDHPGSLKKNRERDGGPLGKAVIRVILVAGYAVLSAVCACADFEVFSAGTGEASTIGVLPFVAALLIAAYLAFGTKAFRYVKERLDRQEDAGRGEALRMEKWKENNRQRQDAEVHAATLAERNRIAREIHDNVGHSLSRALLMTAAISTVNRDENIKPNIEALKNTLNDTMDSVRASVHDLHDESIDLEANIRLLMRDFTFCEVRLDYTGAAGMSREDKYCMLAVVKEALSNIAKHSNASFARITVRSHESMHQLMIEDNGNVSINSDGKGIGLENIENRVKELGGTVYFSDANGFRILITLPVA